MTSSICVVFCVLFIAQSIHGEALSDTHQTDAKPCRHSEGRAGARDLRQHRDHVVEAFDHWEHHLGVRKDAPVRVGDSRIRRIEAQLAKG